MSKSTKKSRDTAWKTRGLPRYRKVYKTILDYIYKHQNTTGLYGKLGDVDSRDERDRDVVHNVYLYVKLSNHKIKGIKLRKI